IVRYWGRIGKIPAGLSRHLRYLILTEHVDGIALRPSALARTSTSSSPILAIDIEAARTSTTTIHGLGPKGLIVLQCLRGRGMPLDIVMRIGYVRVRRTVGH